MRAAAGAIEKVSLDSGNTIIKTIDNKPPVGICGSGIIDVLAELRRIGVLTKIGRIQSGIENVRGAEGSPLEYLLVPANETGIGTDIVISQHDVEEIQLSKGAIMAGINVLLEASGINRGRYRRDYSGGRIRVFPQSRYRRLPSDSCPTNRSKNTARWATQPVKAQD